MRLITRHNDQGVSPRRQGSPKMITPEQVTHHHHFSAQGRYGGTGTFPSIILLVLCISENFNKYFTEFKNLNFGNIREKQEKRCRGRSIFISGVIVSTV